jgi:superfamily II DNA/RNA helicase
VFLSTDAGGVGLNLQCASLIVNMDIPWNPAVLEQRIGRIHRHGQKNTVTVINLVSRGSIEERLLDVLKFKSSLFAGVLDGGEDKIFMGESKFKHFMATVEKVADAPFATHMPVTDVEEQKEHEEKNPTTFVNTPPEVSSDTSASELFSIAESLLDTFAKTFTDKQKTETFFSSLIQKDTSTGKSYIKIPVENSGVVQKATEAFASLLSIFKKQ